MEDALTRRPLAVLAVALLGGVLFLSACKTATPTWESSAEFRLQNVEAALLQVQDELKQLEARQSGDDKKWEEARAKLDELLALLRVKGAAPEGAAPVATPAPARTRPPETGQTLASLPRSASASAASSVAPAAPAAPAAPVAPARTETPSSAAAAPAAPSAQSSEEAAAHASGRLETKPKLWETLPPSALSEEGKAKLAARETGEKVSALVGASPSAAGTAPGPSAYAPSATAPSAPAPSASGTAEKSAYKEALGLAMNGQTAQSKAAFNAFLAAYPASQLTPNALYWIGECDYNQKNYAQSILSFQSVVNRYPGHQKAADSLFKIGMAQEQLGDRAGAAATFQSLAAKYPGSELAGAARSRAGKLAK